MTAAAMFGSPWQAFFWFAMGFLAGVAVPTYYGQERLRGFGRAIVSKLPYQPPPGTDEETAMEEAAETVEESGSR